MARRKKRSGPDLAARFEKIRSSIETETEKELFDIGVIVRDGAAANAHEDSGELKSGYKVKMRHRGQTPVAVVGTSVKHATYFEFAKDVAGHPYLPGVETPRALYKSLDDNASDLVRKIADAVGRGLGRVEGA